MTPMFTFMEKVKIMNIWQFNQTSSAIIRPQTSTELRPEMIFARLRENSHGFWHAYNTLIIMFTLALLADCFSTIYFMSHLGVSAELHPMVRFVSIIFGPVAGPVLGALGKFAVCVYIAIYCKKFAGRIFLGLAIVYILAAWYNIWGIYLII
jgi:hypothetical protein